MDIINEAVAVIRQMGGAFMLRKPQDTDTRWRVQMDGVMLWGDGQNSPHAGMGMIQTTDGRVLLEINTAQPCGICLNDKHGAAISITNEDGRLVIRDERQGMNCILATIP